LILVPTRELGLQVFEVLRLISRLHEFSIGLVVGGKSVKVEQAQINNMNILVATPGRLLQHLGEVVGFHCDNLQFLVIDEADEVLSMGFEESVKQILEYIPKKVQVKTNGRIVN
jgi:ATP-dependent RNA helicase DDX10/DBP4